jgi:predicted phage tail protein
MTISELKKLSRGRWDGSMKRTVVQQWHLGLLTLKEIVLTLKINRRIFRQWVRWEYQHRIVKHKTKCYMKQETKLQELQKQLKALEEKLQYEQLKNEALEMLIDIGKEKYGVDLRKKTGAKQ